MKADDSYYPMVVSGLVYSDGSYVSPEIPETGITCRDELAKAAMQIAYDMLRAELHVGHIYYDTIAETAYQIADAMIAQSKITE